MAFHKKDQVCKAKLQPCAELSNVGDVMYRENNNQATNLIANVLILVEKEKNWKFEITVQLEAAFQTDIEQKLL